MSFCLSHGYIIKSLYFNAILYFRKINKARGCKSDEYRGCEMMIILFLCRNLQTDTTSQQVLAQIWQQYDAFSDSLSRSAQLTQMAYATC